MGKPILVDLDFNSQSRILNLPQAVAAGQPVTFEQLNAAVEGVAWKDNVRVSTQGNINLASPGASIDGVALSINDRVLVRNQSSALENGIYVWNGAAVAMTRAADASTAAELKNAIVPVDEGTDAGKTFRQTQVSFVLDTDPVLFVPFSTDTPDATETAAGKIRISTQVETDTGLDDNSAVTPLKLKNSVHAKKKASGTFGDGSATQFDVTHNFGTRDVIVEVVRSTAPYDTILCDVSRPDVNTVRLNFSAPPAVNQFRVTVVA